jgi:hypothetical protein
MVDGEAIDGWVGMVALGPLDEREGLPTRGRGASRTRAMASAAMAALMVVNVGSRCLKEDGSEVEV